MTDIDRPCPPWCEQPAGDLNRTPDSALNGDFHSGEIATIHLPEISDLRGDSALVVNVEQYVTSRMSYPPTITLDLDTDDSVPVLTPAEADALAAALHQAIATATEGTPQSDDATDSARHRRQTHRASLPRRHPPTRG